MISPDILKQSATAGLAGLAVATTVFGVALSTGGPTGPIVETEPRPETVHVSFERAEKLTARAERAADAAAADRQGPAAREAALQARNRAARRALEKLRSIECRTVDQAKLEAMDLRLHINRAAKDVIEKP